jgi:hypothetical protein
MAFFTWRGKVYSVSVPLALAGIVAAATAIILWLRGW